MAEAQGSNGWWGYLAILKDAADTQTTFAAVGPISCPNDGEPLSSGPHGELFCRFDGWRYEGIK